MAAIFSMLHFLSSLPKINASIRIEFSLFRKDLKGSVIGGDQAYCDGNCGVPLEGPIVTLYLMR